jgi:hypothetical protein
MLNQNHPDDERLAALAGADPDAAGDSTLIAHVDSCARCTSVIDDLRVLRGALAAMPDLVPPRPLRLLPLAEEVRPGGVERLAGFVRRAFAPALTVGATLALVGAVGTGGSLMSLAAPGAAPGEADLQTATDAGAPAAAEESAPTDAAAGPRESVESPQPRSLGAAATATVEPDPSRDQLPAERSPWPMVLFSGVALIVAALLTRWILQPRPA